ncbi:VOC family protein [Sphingomonas sp. NBWT7]|uniref:VOC family protein n=1 Tax=Sphingomonas sp. NBWT7 TaxID=2596913 RepID=UPI001CA5AC7F|nr:VOC family protein [Sphingomonas sp. NBWT7]
MAVPAPAMSTGTGRLIVNIDVPDLARAQAFYCGVFGLTPARRLGPGVLQLVGLDAPIYLLEVDDGSRASDQPPARRDYRRHWTPVHLDVAVDDLDRARAAAIAAGARDEGGIR